MTKKLTKNEIKNLLPHREPMLLIDELVDIVKLKSAKAIVYVKKNSFYVQGIREMISVYKMKIDYKNNY